MNKSVLTKYSHWKIPDLCQLILVSIMRWDMKPWGIASESSRSYTPGPIKLKAQGAWAAPHCMNSPGCPWTQNSLGWISFDTATHYGILRYLTLNQLVSIQMMTRLSLPRSQKPPIWRIPLGSWEMEGSISFGGGGRDANMRIWSAIKSCCYKWYRSSVLIWAQHQYWKIQLPLRYQLPFTWLC